MIAAAPAAFSPARDLYHVRLIEPAERTAGGIYLPETSRRNSTEGTVLAVGRGRLIPGTAHCRTIQWADPGDHVLFHGKDFHPISPDSREGMVADEALMAILDPDTGDVAVCLGEWCLVDLEPWEEQKGSIVVPELDRHRPSYGRLRRWGPGRRIEDALYRRHRIDRLLDVPERAMDGLLVYWRHSEEVYEIGRERVSGLLVKASDIIALREY